MRRCTGFGSAALLLFLLLAAMDAAAPVEDWPQFLGPHRNNAVVDERFAQAWLKDAIREKWRIPIGEGYSGIVTSGDRLFTMESRDDEESLVAVRASDGGVLWRIRTGDSPRDVYGGLGPRVTPSVDGTLVFAVSARGDLFAAQVDSGKLAWKRPLAQEMGWRPPAEGTSCSPLVSDGRIYLIVGGGNGKAVAAFDRNTGKTSWTSQEDRASYSSAIRWKTGGIEQVLFLTGSKLVSLDPASGALLWSYPWPTYDFVNVATPLLVGSDRVFLSSAYDQGAALLRVRSGKPGELVVDEVWKNREMKNHFNNSVYHDGAFYGFDNSIFKAIDAATGKTLWSQSGFGKGSVILTGSYLLLLTERGELICARADRAKFQAAKRLKVLDGVCWTPPSLVGSTLYLRSPREVVSLSVQ